MKDPIKCLKKLGTNVKTIAASLKRRKIKGKRDHGTGCPLAIYLQKCGFKNAEVEVENIEIPNDLSGYEGERLRYPLPKPFKNFLQKFDNEQAFPELVKGVEY